MSDTLKIDSLDAPDAPGQPRVEDVDKDHVTLSWSAPLRDGGSKITGFVVEKKKLGDDDWSKAANLPPSTTTATVDQLETNAEYEFRVRAVNAAGPGEPSLPSELRKIVPKQSREFLPLTTYPNFILVAILSDLVPFLAKPNGPEEVSVKNVLANSCTVEWTPPKSDGGSPVTGYAVEMCDEATGVWTPVSKSTKGNSVEVPGLTEGHRYNFRVSAINDLGRSEPTETLLSTLAKNPFGM